jgi:hypothetical protein
LGNACRDSGRVGERGSEQASTLRGMFGMRKPQGQTGTQRASWEGVTTYGSDVVLGETYRDVSTGIEGRVIMLTFFEHACERAVLEWVSKDGDLKSEGFDAMRLVRVSTGQQAESEKTGGPDRGCAALRREHAGR